ncbi:MAG: RNA polymerase factor sigma-54 [Gallionella sp.]
MRATLQLRQSQHLTLTPQLQQAIRLLQLSTQDMQQEVARMLEENPLLEVAEAMPLVPFTGEAQTPESIQLAAPDTASTSAESNNERDSEPALDEAMDWQSSATGAANHDEDDDKFPEQAACCATLREHLQQQLQLTQLSPLDQKLIAVLIDALDENGYLTQSLEDILALLPVELDISLDDLETALVQLQHLDMPGLAARDLAECLALQLKAMPADTPQRALGIRLVSEHLPLLGAHDFVKIKRYLRCSDEELRSAQSLIATLNPKPGNEFDESIADRVIPDVLVEKHQGVWRVRLNGEALPKLRVNQLYANILHQRGEKTGSQLGAQLQEAHWLIKNLQQRFDTILRVAQAIVIHQEQFLEHGAIAMRPLVLREIADELELHESTVSRATTQKFMLTPRGIYEFKYFFGSALSTDGGGNCSSTAIRELIKQLVGAEDKMKPLTDSRMSEILAQQGVVIARRTIAKYREELHILPVHLRKSL